VAPHKLRRRADAVTDGGVRDAVLLNAPETAEGFFVVPKVVE
jgi:aspartyl-tRNA(Asn)/glutamyl-tRNA(Gln) amidotransferase subunit C